jgi:hypothetical protein
MPVQGLVNLEGLGHNHVQWSQFDRIACRITPHISCVVPQYERLGTLEHQVLLSVHVLADWADTRRMLCRNLAQLCFRTLLTHVTMQADRAQSNAYISVHIVYSTRIRRSSSGI